MDTTINVVRRSHQNYKNHPISNSSFGKPNNTLHGSQHEYDIETSGARADNAHYEIEKTSTPSTSSFTGKIFGMVGSIFIFILSPVILNVLVVAN